MNLRFRRVPVSVYCPVTFSGNDVKGQGALVDISDRGWKIRCYKKRIPKGAYLTLRIAPPGEQAAIRVERAVVQWSREGEFGVELLRLGPADEERLRRFTSSLETKTFRS